MQELYVCQLCKKRGQEFSTPFDIIGATLMSAHLADKHDIDPRADTREMILPPEEL